MNLNFWKMHGAGNDFILFDDRDELFPINDHKWLAQIMHRRTGIGSEGVILIQKSKTADFRMRFFNPDGCEVSMCGNGARCAAKLAYNLKINNNKSNIISIETLAGVLKAKIISSDKVMLSLTKPKDWRLNQKLELSNGEELAYNFINTGVEHVVIFVGGTCFRASILEDINIAQIGREIRYHSEFAPKGTNVNFVEKKAEDLLSVRTYERGVESETLACGTGITAAALVAGMLGFVKSPTRVQCLGSEILIVDYNLNNVDSVTLTGSAIDVFTGTISYRSVP